MRVQIDATTTVDIPKLEYPFSSAFADQCLDIYLVAAERSAAEHLDTQKWLWDAILSKIDPETAAAISHVVGSYDLAGCVNSL